MHKHFLMKNSHNSLNFQDIATKVLHNNFQVILHHVQIYRDVPPSIQISWFKHFFLKILNILRIKFHVPTESGTHETLGTKISIPSYRDKDK